MKNNINKIIYTWGNIYNELNSESECINFVDSINQYKWRTRVVLGKSCSEYLSEDDNINTDMTLAIPVRACFPAYSDNEVKKAKIIEYIDYLNSTGLFNYKLIDSEKSKKSISKFYVKSSLMDEYKDDLNLKFIGYLSKYGAGIEESRSSFYDYKITSTSYFKTKGDFDEFSKEVDKLIKSKYSHLLSDEDSELKIRLNNNSYYKFSSFFKTHLDPIFVTKNLRAFNIIEGYQSSNNYSINVKNQLISAALLNSENQLGPSIISYNIKKDLENTLEFDMLTSEIMEVFYKYLMTAYPNFKKKKVAIQNLYFKLRVSFIQKLLDGQDMKEYILDQSEIVKDVEDNYVFIKINNSKTNICNRTGLLLQLTLIRYMFFKGVSHLADVILNFKNNIKDLSLLDNLSISSQIHKNEAWNRWNIMNVKGGDNLGEFEESDTRYFKIEEESNIIQNLCNSNDYSEINTIFSNEDNMFKLKEESLINFHKNIEKLYKNKKYQELVDIFKGVTDIKTIINKPKVIFNTKSTKTKKIKNESVNPNSRVSSRMYSAFKKITGIF